MPEFADDRKGFCVITVQAELDCMSSVGELVRDATEIQYGVGGVAARLRALEAMSKLETPVGEPEEIERDISKGALEEHNTGSNS